MCAGVRADGLAGSRAATVPATLPATLPDRQEGWSACI